MQTDVTKTEARGCWLQRPCCAALVVILNDLAQQEWGTARIHSNPGYVMLHQERGNKLAELAEEIAREMQKQHNAELTGAQNKPKV